MKKPRIEFVTSPSGNPVINVDMLLTQEEEDAMSNWVNAVVRSAREEIFREITRVTLVDDDRGGIQYERYNINVEYSIQDNGKTLKLFIKGAE